MHIVNYPLTRTGVDEKKDLKSIISAKNILKLLL